VHAELSRESREDAVAVRVVHVANPHVAAVPRVLADDVLGDVRQRLELIVVHEPAAKDLAKLPVDILGPDGAEALIEHLRVVARPVREVRVHEDMRPLRDVSLCRQDAELFLGAHAVAVHLHR